LPARADVFASASRCHGFLLSRSIARAEKSAQEPGGDKSGRVGDGREGKAMGEFKVKTEVAGRVCALPLAVGAAVKKGDDVAVVEAMKMEIPVASPVDGKVRAILVAVDEVVAEGQALMVLDA
jgi:acetyl-CoA carboxylase biotin carboxyl carrier protein